MPDVLQEFQEKKQKLAEILQISANQVSHVGHHAVARMLLAKRHEILQRQFNVVVVGEFSSGKSTLLNALLGQKLLPAKMAPCTKAILEIQYGETPRLMVHREGVAEPEEHAPTFLNEIGVLAARELDEIRKERAASEITRLALEVPNPPCDVGVTLLDTPGLNEHEERTRITAERLPKADASIIVLRATDLLSKSERDFIQSEAKKEPVNRRWLENAFVVVTFADVATQDDSGELVGLKARLNEFMDGVLPPGIARGRRFFIDARSALARRAGGRSSTDGVDFDRFESVLRRYLVEQRGRVTFQGQKITAEAAISNAVGSLVADRESQSRDAEELRATVDGARKIADEERRRLAMIIQGLRDRAPRLGRDLTNEFTTASRRWVERGLPAYIDTLEYPESVWVRTGPVVEWYTRHASSWLEAEMQNWANTVPPCYLQDFLEDFEQAFREDLEDLKSNLRKAGRDLGLSQFELETPGEDALGWLVRNAAGLLAGGPLGAAVGGLLGWDGVVKNLAINLAMGFVAGFFAVAVPIMGFVIAAAVVAAAQIGLGQKKIKRRVADQVKAGLAESLPTAMDEAAGAVREASMQAVDEIADELLKGGEGLLEMLDDAADNAERAAQASEAKRLERGRILDEGVSVLEQARQHVSAFVV